MYDTPIFRSEFKVISHELIHALPKVILGESGDAAYMQSRVQQLADDHVAYFECTVPHEDIERAISVAEQAPFTVGILGRIDDSSHYTDRSRTPVVVGFSTQSADVAAILRENYVPFEFDGSVADQVRVGASRIIHGIGLFEDFRFEDDDIVPGRLSAWVRDRDYPVLVEPFADLENGEVAELADHPLPLMSKLGYRTASSILSTDRLLELTEYLELQIEDLFELTRDAVAVSLLPQPLRVQLWEELVFPFFEQLGEDFADHSTTDDAESTTELRSEREHAGHAHTDHHGGAAGLEGVDPQFLDEMGIEFDDLDL